ncbi:MAG TPA: hypothetical protein VGZ29_01820 [Terriglobia bacterium]|nr:hypothetical protein [Terriglobia bacterium]
MSSLNLVVLFSSGVILGVVVCRVRDNAKLALYRRFIEDRLGLKLSLGLSGPFPSHR